MVVSCTIVVQPDFMTTYCYRASMIIRIFILTFLFLVQMIAQAILDNRFILQTCCCIPAIFLIECEDKCKEVAFNTPTPPPPVSTHFISLFITPFNSLFRNISDYIGSSYFCAYLMLKL